jgi:exonuclease SbcC
MKLIRLKMTNFKKFRSAEIEFRDGLTGIIGNNGAGKSTIVEAISWSLYGSKTLSIKKDFLKNSAAANNDPLNVTLVLETGNQEWSISRGLKSNGLLEAFVKINGETIASGVRDVDEYLMNKLHTSAQDFEKTFYARQKDLDNLLKEGGTGKKEYLLKLLNFDYIKTKSIDQIRADIRDNESKKNHLAGRLTEIGDVDSGIAETSSKISIAGAELDELENNEKNLTGIVQQSEMDCEMHSKKQQSHKHMADEIAKLELSASKRREQLKSENSRLAEIDGLKKHLWELQPKLDRLSQVNMKLEELEPVKKNYDDLRKAKEIENKGNEGLQRRLKESLGRLSALQKSEAILKRLSGNEEEYCKLQKEIPELELIRDNHNKVKSALENEKTKIFSLESAISKAEKTIDELMKLQATLKIIEPLKHDYDALQKELSIVEIQKNKKYQIDNLNARADFLLGQISKLSEDANATDHELSALSNLDEREAILIEQDKSMHAIGEKLNRNLIDLKSRGSVYQSKRDEAKSSLERVRNLGAKGNCPTCERPLGEQHEVLLSKYMRELSDADARSAELDTEIRTIENNIEKNILDREDIKRSLDSINCDKSRRAGLNAHLKAKLEQKNGIQAEMEGVRKSIEDLGAAEYDPARYDEIASKIKEIQPQIIEYDSLVIRLMELSRKEKELKTLREEQMVCVKTLQDLNENLAGLNYDESKYTLLKKRKIELEPDHEYYITSRQKVGEIPNLNTEISLQQIELDDSRKSLSQIDISMNNLRFAPSDYEALLKEKKNLSRLQDEAQQIRIKMAPEAEIKSRRDDTAKAISDIEKEISKAKDESIRIGYDDNSHQKAKASLSEFKKKLEMAKEECSSKRIHLGVLNGELQRLKANEKKKKDYERDQAEAFQNLDMLNIIRDLLDGFLDQLLIRIRKEIEEFAGEILYEISGKYNKIKIDDEFNICVEDGGEFYPITRYFSGGEIDMIAVSVRVAISQYLMGQKIGGLGGYSFLILDEVFGSQDMIHRENMINMLRRLDMRFPQIIVISHISDVQGQFDNTIYVTENESGNSIVESN